MKQAYKKYLWGLVGVIGAPIVLFLLLAVLLYLPPVQRWAVAKASAMVEKETGLRAEIEQVRLAFPLDLAAHGVLVTRVASQAAPSQADRLVAFSDTVCAARSLRLHIPLRPLFAGRADVDGFDLVEASLDTRDLLPDVRVRGRVGGLSCISRGVEWSRARINLNNVALRDADLFVWIADTAAADTVATPLQWNIALQKASVRNTRLHLVMPADSMRINLDADLLTLQRSAFDLAKGAYGVEQSTLRFRSVACDLPYMPAAPAGLDVNHLRLRDVLLQTGPISYEEPFLLHADLKKIAFKEQSGLEVRDLSGHVRMDEQRLRIPALRLHTAASEVALDADVNWRALSAGEDADVHVGLLARVGRADVLALAAPYVPKEFLALYPSAPLSLSATLSGTLADAHAENVKAEWPGVLSFTANARVQHAMTEHPSVNATFAARTGNLNCFSPLLPQCVRIPAGLALSGKGAYATNRIQADVRAALRDGSLALKALLNPKTETYEAQLAARAFPFAAFLPELGIGAFSGDVKAKGAGFDFSSPRTYADADVQVAAFSYADIDLSGSTLAARLAEQKTALEFAARTSVGTATGTGLIDLAGGYNATIEAELAEIDLQTLGVPADSLQLNGHFSTHLAATDDFSQLTARGGLRNIFFVSPQNGFTVRDVDYNFQTASESTEMQIQAGDLNMQLAAPTDLTALIADLTRFADDVAQDDLPVLLARAAGPEALADLQAQIAADSTSVVSFLAKKAERLQPLVFPNLTIHVHAANKNPLYGIVRHFGYDFRSLHLDLATSPEAGIVGKALAGHVDTGTMTLDTLHVNLSQTPEGLQLEGVVRNYEKRNPTRFEAQLRAQLLTTGATLHARLLDAQGREGMNLGARADLQDGGMRFSITPHHPVLAYRRFEVNRDNYIFLGNNHTLHAALDLLADDGTGLKVYGAPTETGEGDITVSVSHLNLSELSSVVPGFPALGGFLTGDAHLTLADSTFTTAFAMETQDFAIEGTPLGSFGMEGFLLPKGDDAYEASAFLLRDDAEVMTLAGTYWDRGDASRFAGTADLTEFPLEILNGFLAGTDFALKGKAEGSLAVEGTLDAPRMNGELDLSQMHLLSEVYGVDFRMDQKPVSITDSRMQFADYAFYSTGTAPLMVNGLVNMQDLSAIALNLRLNAQNFELINAKKKRNSLIYGKMFTNLAATCSGTLDALRIKGDIEVLDRTDLTYILKDSPLTVDDQLADLVQFTSFTDSVEAEVAPVSASTINMTLGIDVSDAARFHCLLSENGENYVDVQGGGALTFRLTEQDEMLLTGRFTMEEGEMKYSLPVIPLKTFRLKQGSYVEFTGDVLSPTLSLRATERVKAVVTENEVPRSIPFDVGVDITGTLEKMGLAFIIDAPDDLGVQNQLTSMSDEQRGKAAVTMLVTGMYMTDEAMLSGSGFKASNALNAFLQSEIQNIAGSALKSIDLSLGVESGTSAVGTSTTDYSFQFAKRFWGDRISVIIGGSVSTGADAENSAATFIDNVTVAYRLDKSATRYVQAFYDRATRDALEGQLSKTGVGLVLRRKTDRLSELFLFRKKKSQK